jgi:deoxyhypusine synthase
MIWPRYGVTPDVGSYGESAASHGVTPLSHNLSAPEPLNGRTLPAGESFQVNPTASISGLLEKLTATAGAARAVGQCLATWELAARDPDATIALALNTPVIAEGMRELLVYAIEHRYVDVVVATADDMAADLYEALGQVHFGAPDGPVATDMGREHVSAFLKEFLVTLDLSTVTSGVELLRQLGEALPSRAPRKGLLQAAAASGVMVLAPDLSTSVFGAAAISARNLGASLSLDAATDLEALTERLAERPRLAIVRTGEGSADTLLQRSRDIAVLLDLTSPTLTGSVSLGTGCAVGTGDRHVATVLDPVIALPLMVTGLAQRMPGVRVSLRDAVGEQLTSEEPTLA